MLRRNRFGLGLGCALLAATASVPLYADEAATAPAAAAAATPPLMGGLESVGIGKPMEDARITAGGWIEAGYQYDFGNAAGGALTGRIFDVKAQDPTLHQAALFVERTVDPSAGKFDLGFRVEGLYGSDGGYIHTNGLNFYGGDAPQIYPENQVDLTQAYVDIALPVGRGLKIRAGKFVTLLGYETINPTTDPLYSRPYLFGYAIPFLHTGILGSYSLTDSVTVTAGITRGWEQSTKDNNDMIDFIGQVSWKLNEKSTLIVSGISGPEQTDNNSNYRSVLDVIYSYAATDQLTLAVNGDYGYEADGGIDGDDASWYGVAGYAGYKLTDMMTLNGRLEWFSDPDGARGLDTTVYEATAGLTIKPFPNHRYLSGLMLRPEIRYDYSADAIYDGGTDNYQITVGGDVILTF